MAKVKRRTAEEIEAAKKAEEEAKEKDLVASIYGDLMDLTEHEDKFFKSGSYVIDSVISNGKGIPLGKFISLTSSEGVGKSSMCLHIARNCCVQGYRCLYIDTECGLNPSQIESFSMTPYVRNKTFLVKQIRNYRDLDELFGSVLKDPSLKFIFLDSLTDVIPDQVMANNIADLNQPGLDARAQALFLRKYKFPIEKAGITVFFILQQRTKIGMSYGERTMEQAAGGHAARHAMDISLELVKKETLKRTVKGHDEAIPYGSECFLRSTKNRYAPPMIPMLIQILFGKGVSNSGAVANALILNGIVKTPTKYVINYQGEEITLVTKSKYNEFIKSHLDYYKKVVDDCGGIRLLPESEAQQPNDIVSEDEDEENTNEGLEDVIEESGDLEDSEEIDEDNADDVVEDKTEENSEKIEENKNDEVEDTPKKRGRKPKVKD